MLVIVVLFYDGSIRRVREEATNCLGWGKITKPIWPNYKVNYKICLYRDSIRRNSTRCCGGKLLPATSLMSEGRTDDDVTLVMAASATILRYTVWPM